MAFKKYTALDVSEKIIKIHNNNIVLDISTYKNTFTKARFIDKDYGEWWAEPRDILSGGKHMQRAIDDKKITLDEITLRLENIREDIISIDKTPLNMLRKILS